MVYETPDGIEGDPYIRVPVAADKIKVGFDRELNDTITLWDEKIKYPYKTKIESKLVVITNQRRLTFTLKLDENVKGAKSFVWNGQNIPTVLWSLLRISKDSPVGLKASKWHDNLLYKKCEFLQELRVEYPETKVSEYRRLTTLIYRQWLKTMGVNTFKANFMAGAVGAWQFVSPQWWGVK